MGFENSRREQTLMKLKNIVLQSLQDVPVNVYLFGSWARKEERRTSDIDIALHAAVEIPIEKLVRLRENIEESTLPYNVDIVNLSKANPELMEKVQRKGILWKGCTNGLNAQTGY